MAHWERKHPYRKPWSLGEAAALGQLVQVRCNLCRRTIYFLAADLVEFLSAGAPALRVPFPCGKCQTDEFMRVKLHLPEAGDWGNLPVRRPAEVVHIQKWRTVKLGDDVKPPTPRTFEDQQSEALKAARGRR